MKVFASKLLDTGARLVLCMVILFIMVWTFAMSFLPGRDG